MRQDITAKRLTRVGLTQDRSRCRLEFEYLNGKTGALSFPFDQVQSLLELLLQVETQAVERLEESPGAKRSSMPTMLKWLSRRKAKP